MLGGVKWKNQNYFYLLLCKGDYKTLVTGYSPAHVIEKKIKVGCHSNNRVLSWTRLREKTVRELVENSLDSWWTVWRLSQGEFVKQLTEDQFCRNELSPRGPLLGTSEGKRKSGDQQWLKPGPPPAPPWAGKGWVNESKVACWKGRSCLEFSEWKELCKY